MSIVDENKVIPEGGLVVTPGGLSSHIKGQLRIWVAAICGAIVVAAANKLHLPILTAIWGVQGEQVVGQIVGGLGLLGVALWQYLRTRLVNQRWWVLAKSVFVPNELVRPAEPKL